MYVGPSPFALPIFGGEHGDLPLNAHAGKLIGETVASMAESCIVSLGGLATKTDERSFMLAFLDTMYRKASGNPVHVIFDEADLWAPQKSSEPKLQSLMEQIVRRGRVRGFIPWLITQRPAVLSKDVLSQVDGLIAFKLTSSQDRDAIGAWIDGQADRETGKAILASLPTMQRGEGVVWVPGRAILDTAQFPAKATFDSSRTPMRGERREARELTPLNLDALKAEVARLARELAATQKGGAAPAWPDQREEVKRLVAELEEMSASTQRLTTAAAELQRRQQAALAALTGEVVPIPAVTRPQPRPSPASVPVQRQPSPVREPRQSDGDGTVPAGCAKPLAALAGVFPSGLTEAQWSTAAGYKRSGGTWGTYKSRLRGAGMIEQREGRWFATEAGAAAVGDVELPPRPGPELVRWWAAKLPGVSKMAEALIEAWPDALSKDELAFRVDMSASGGSFGTYLSRLAGPGLIDRSGGEIRLTAEVMVV